MKALTALHAVDGGALAPGSGPRPALSASAP
jgi:hypothetical protein